MVAHFCLWFYFICRLLLIRSIPAPVVAHFCLWYWLHSSVHAILQVRGEAQALRAEMETQRNRATQLEQLFQQQVTPASM